MIVFSLVMLTFGLIAVLLAWCGWGINDSLSVWGCVRWTAVWTWAACHQMSFAFWTILQCQSGAHANIDTGIAVFAQTNMRTRNGYFQELYRGKCRCFWLALQTVRADGGMNPLYFVENCFPVAIMMCVCLNPVQCVSHIGLPSFCPPPIPTPLSLSPFLPLSWRSILFLSFHVLSPPWPTSLSLLLSAQTSKTFRTIRIDTW